MGKRGRPPVLSDDQRAKLAEAYPQISHRHKMNLWYADRARRIIKALPCSEYYSGKVSLLAELGRVKDEEAIRKAAVVLAEHGREHRLPVEKARRLVRVARRELEAERNSGNQ